MIPKAQQQTNSKQTMDILSEGKCAQGTMAVILEFHIQASEVSADEACCQHGSPTLTDKAGCGHPSCRGSSSCSAHETFKSEQNSCVFFTRVITFGRSGGMLCAQSWAEVVIPQNKQGRREHRSSLRFRNHKSPKYLSSSVFVLHQELWWFWFACLLPL